MNNQYASVREAQAAFDAVPSYVDRPMSQEEEEELCYRLRQLELAQEQPSVEVVGIIDLAWR